MNPAASLNPCSKILENLAREPRGRNLTLCHTCASCLSRCFLRDEIPESNPRRYVRLVSNGWDDAALSDRLIWSCTLCNRCTFDCPMGIRMDEVVRAVRGLQAERGDTPEVLKEGVAGAIETGNVSMIPQEEYVETVEWLTEELQDDLEDESVAFPLDEQGAKYVFLPNPRQINIIPMHFIANAKIFVALGEKWTVSKDLSDVTNWAYFTGETGAMRKIALRVVEAVEALQAETLVLTECGHGFKLYARDLERVIGRKPGFRVVSIIELIAQGIRDGRLKMDPGKNASPATYHDPCNLGRKAGVLDEPREILRACVPEFVEMWPNREFGICCGGGGGVDRVPESTAARTAAARGKVDQILRTGARVVATGCLSCMSTIQELKKHYKLDIEVATVVELAAKALEM